MLGIKPDVFVHRHLPQGAYEMKDINPLFLLWSPASGALGSACSSARPTFKDFYLSIYLSKTWSLNTSPPLHLVPHQKQQHDPA